MALEAASGTVEECRKSSVNADALMAQQRNQPALTAALSILVVVRMAPIALAFQSARNNASSGGAISLLPR